MPLDARIISEAPDTGYKIPALGEIRNQTIAADLTRRKLEQARDEAHQAALRRQAAQASDGDVERYLENLQRAGLFDDAVKLQGDIDTSREKTLGVLIKQNDNEAKQIDSALEMAALVRDEPTYQAWRAATVKTAPKFDSLLPPTYDPTVMPSILGAGAKGRDVLKAQRDAFELGQKGELVASLGGYLLTVPPEQRDEILDSASTALHYPRAVIDRFRGVDPNDPQYAEKVKALTLTPKEQADLANTAADNLRADEAANRQASQDAITNAYRGREVAATEGNLRARQAEGASASAPMPTTLPPQARAVADRVLVGVPGTRVGSIKQGLNNLAKNGASEDEVKSFLKLAAVETLGEANKTAMIGRIQTLTALKDAEAALKSVPTGLIKGTWEDTMRALGTTSDPKLVELSTRMGAILANYMRSISGAAIADKEAERLGNLMPSYKKTLEVNIGRIKGFSEALRSFDNAFYQYKFGNNYDWVMGTSGNTPPPAGAQRQRPAGVPATATWNEDRKMWVP